MRHFISYLLISLFMFSISHDAFAKRFGGGRSFGGHRSHQTAPLHTEKAKPATKQNTKPNKGGLIGGLLVGGLLASLFMAHGLGAGLLSWLVLGSLAFFLIQFFRKKMQPHVQAVPVQAQSLPQNEFKNSSTFYQSTSSTHNSLDRFNKDSFLRAIKVIFIRLQAAYDQKNIQDLSEFTALDVFAEIKMQLDERGVEPNITEVIHLDAELLTVSEQTNEANASVRFTGKIKENDKMIELDEVWHFRQSANDKWIVTGIEQSVVSEFL